MVHVRLKNALADPLDSTSTLSLTQESG